MNLKAPHEYIVYIHTVHCQLVPNLIETRSVVSELKHMNRQIRPLHFVHFFCKERLKKETILILIIKCGVLVSILLADLLRLPYGRGGTR
jgi:hypothetical protein